AWGVLPRLGAPAAWRDGTRRNKKQRPQGPPEWLAGEQKAPRRHKLHAKPLAYYAELNKVGLRTLKRCIHRGKQRGDPAPIEDPDKFQHWRARHYDSRGNHAPKVQDKTTWLFPP